MSANSKPAAPTTLKVWLKRADDKLTEANIGSARLDAQLLLAHVLKKDREWLLAHDDEKLTAAQTRKAGRLLKRRLNHEPLAYITGYKEFYGRDFKVDGSVLIPRPETEELIDLLKELKLPKETEIIDVGTGSGALAVTAALELPHSIVSATDISPAALKTARKNARLLKAKLKFYESDLLSDLPFGAEERLDVVLANLPYVDSDYPISEEAKAEPKIALFADKDGYELIERLLPQAADLLKLKGYLLIESDPWQQDRITKSASKYGFRVVTKKRFHLVFQKTS